MSETKSQFYCGFVVLQKQTTRHWRVVSCFISKD
jgi:hypothetical protein